MRKLFEVEVLKDTSWRNHQSRRCQRRNSQRRLLEVEVSKRARKKVKTMDCLVVLALIRIGKRMI